MAFPAQHVESACKTGLTAALTAAAITGVSFRCYWFDDESGSDEEKRVFPMIALITDPAIYDGLNNGSGAVNNLNDIKVRQQLIIATHEVDDPKRATLTSVYDTVRAALNTRNFATDFTTIGSNLTFAAVQVLGAQVGIGGVSESEREQFVDLDLEWTVCGTP